MNRYALLLALAISAPVAPIMAQAPAAPTCLPTTTLDELIKAIDAGVSGPAASDRACMRDLLLPDARLAPIAKAADGSFAPHLLTFDAWNEGIHKRGNVTVYEHQVKVSSEVYGHVAHLWSTYELRLDDPTGKPYARGINSIQAAYDGKRWRILEILWQTEAPELPIPAKYLP